MVKAHQKISLRHYQAQVACKILAVFLLLFTGSCLAQDATAVVEEARRLHDVAKDLEARWIAGVENLTSAEQYLEIGNMDLARDHAEKAIRFFNLGIEQSSYPLYKYSYYFQ